VNHLSPDQVERHVAAAVVGDQGIGYALVDPQLTIVAHNPELPRLIGALKVDLVGCPLLDLFPELVGAEESLQLLLSGELPRLEVEMSDRSTQEGEPRYLTIIDVPWYASGDKPCGILHVVTDVTAQGTLLQTLVQQRNALRLLEEELDRRNRELSLANARLTKLNADKSAFLSMAAHDMRLPLTSIKAYLEMITDGYTGPVSDSTRSYLDIIASNTERLIALINDLLDLEKIESGQATFNRELLDLPTLIHEVVQSFLAQAHQKPLDLVVVLDESLPQVWGDRAQIERVLVNLVSNAVKYTPAGGTVRVQASHASGEVQVSVADTGPGISQADQARLFDRFFRSENPETRALAGTGLGLSIVKSIVERHGGRIWVRSRPGKGSTFTFSLPLEGSLPADTGPERSQ